MSSFIIKGELSNQDAPVPITKELVARERKVITINKLSEGMRDWIIKIVVIHKGIPRSWKNAKGNGRVFNFEVVDFYNRHREDLEDHEII